MTTFLTYAAAAAVSYAEFAACMWLAQHWFLSDAHRHPSRHGTRPAGTIWTVAAAGVAINLTGYAAGANIWQSLTAVTIAWMFWPDSKTRVLADGRCPVCSRRVLNPRHSTAEGMITDPAQPGSPARLLIHNRCGDRATEALRQLPGVKVTPRNGDPE